MHRTLKTEATRPAGSNFLQQQAKFDAFVREFNNERPHEALAMKRPADIYKPSTRPYRGIGELSYPFHDRTALVTCCGRICIYKKKINLSTSLAGQAVGIKEVDDGIWLVSFMDYDLGYIDLEEKTLQPLNNPFGPKVSDLDRRIWSGRFHSKLCWHNRNPSCTHGLETRLIPHFLCRGLDGADNQKRARLCALAACFY
jgi:hypothetical protein